MEVLFRVNNELFGILHLNAQDQQDSSIDLRRFPASLMLPRSMPIGFLSSRGFKKGDPMIVVFDKSLHINALKNVEGEILWNV